MKGGSWSNLGLRGQTRNEPICNPLSQSAGLSSVESESIDAVPLANFDVGYQEPKHVACPNLQATSAISIIFQLPDADDNAARDAIGMVTISVAITNGAFQMENGELARQEGGRACSPTTTGHQDYILNYSE